ncbi:MAG TPA: alginate lyase family protein [Steroidobacteraceae bacterium]|nr:alginate lyase family protein [Steroidobacteraceae bacterium]
MLDRLKKLRGRSVDELRVRGLQYVAARMERVGLSLRSSQSAKYFNDDILDSLRFRGLAPDEPLDIAHAVAELDPEVVTRFTEQTHHIREGSLSLLGLGLMRTGNPPNWHRDASSGRCAPRKHWSQISFLDRQIVGDHKVLWEVNRHQYLYAPALLWLIKRDGTDFELVQNHLASWLDENPDKIGVNWSSSLEVAYRAITWCWLLWLLRDAPWNRDLLRRVYRSLETHALHIERYLSTYFSPNTHLTGEALSLFYVGSMLPHAKCSARLRSRGARILERSLTVQVRDDGVYFEQASQYQRYTAEIFLHYAQLAQSTGWQVGSSVTEKLRNLLFVLRTMADGSGNIPLMGDDDGGLLLPLDHRSPDCVSGLLLAGAAYFRCPELIPTGASRPTLSLWITGIERTRDILQRFPARPSWTNRHFREGGIAVVRDGWDSHGAVAVIDAGPHGALNCGHAHADALALTLSLGRQPVFIDRGTLTYVGDERDEFRVTSAHNTMEFDASSSIEPRGPFQWGIVPQKPLGRLTEAGDVSAFFGLAYGHPDSDQPSTHERVVMHIRHGLWLILDQGNRPDAKAVVRWQLHPDLGASNTGEGSLQIVNRDAALVAVFVPLLLSDWKCRNREVSLRFGGRQPASLIEISADESLRVYSLVVPASSSGLSSAFTTSTSHVARAWRWDDDSGRHHLVVPNSISEDFREYGCQVAADLILFSESAAVRGTGSLRPDTILLVNAQRLRFVDSETSVAEIPSTSCPQWVRARVVVLRRTDGGWVIIPFSEPG